MSKRSIEIAVSLTFLVIDQILAVFKTLFLRSEGKSGFVIVYYHVVLGEERDRFEAQMKLIKRWSEPVSMDALENQGNGRKHSVVVTFDDGSESVLNNAYPILKKEGIPFTIFVPAHWMGMPAGWIKSGQEDAARDRIMSQEQLVELSKDPLTTIASHGLRHRRLTELAEEESRDEISRSKVELERILGAPVKYFSFPYGAFGDKELDYARVFGYTRVFSILPEKGSLPSRGFVQGRVRVDPSDFKLETILKVRGCYRWKKQASRFKRFLTKKAGVNH